MEDEILEEFNKIKDKVSQEEFLERLEYYREKNKDINFISDVDNARQVVGEYITEENQVLSENEEYARNSINKLEDGDNNIAIVGRVMGISNPKLFTTKKGKKGKVANVELADDTGSIRIVFWTENIKLLKNFNEGEIIQVSNVDVKDGYSGLEATMKPRSTVKHVDEEEYPNFPKYNEEITNIADIEPDTTVNIIARIVRIPGIRTYERDGQVKKVASLELQDATGSISYTLWNNNVDLIDALELKDGDTVKILSAEVRERNGELSLSHWDGRIIKGEFDIPEFENDFIKIGEIREQNDVSTYGVVTKLQDIKKFIRKSDGKESQLRNFDLTDETGSIRVTLWGDDVYMDINKGDIVKIIGGSGRFDDYTASGYSLNTNWNSQISVLDIEDLDENQVIIFEEIKSRMGPMSIEQIQELDEDDGEEVDVIGRIISINDINEFQRDDGSVGFVRSAMFSDGTGTIQLSFWDDRAQQAYNPGEAYKIENARTKLGMYSVDLNVGASARIIKLTDEEAIMLPSYETLVEMIYETKKIDELDEDDQNITVIARVIEVNDPHEFERQNGESGLVRNIEIADLTGTIRVVLWDSNADIALEEGEAIKIENPRVAYNMNDNLLELQTNRSTSILTPLESEISELPTFDELKSEIYKSKTIEMLEDDDSKVRITGQIEEPSGNKLLLTKCPHCNNTIEDIGDEFVCDFCGEDFDEPRYLLMIPARLKDDTGDISITFFNDLAEDLLGMKKEEVVSIIEDSGDLGALDGKVEDLTGLTIEVIADVNFDEFNEEIRLNPKKILDKYY